MKAVANKQARPRSRSADAWLARIPALVGADRMRVFTVAALAVALLAVGYLGWRYYSNREVDYLGALKTSPAFPAYRVGVAAASERRYQEAESAFQRALKEDGRNALIYNALATMYIDQGETQKALVAAEQGVTLAPGSPDLLYTLGLTRYHLGKFEDAEQSLRRALEIRPEFPRASLWLGNTLMILARTGLEGGFRPELLEEAIGHYEDAVDAEPDEASFHAALGDALFQKRDLAGARSHLELAVKLDSKTGKYHVALGRVCEQLGDLEAARDAFRTATSVERTDKEAFYGLGVVLAKLGSDEEAEAALRRCLEIDRYHTDAHQVLGDLLVKLGRQQEGEQELALAEQSRQQERAIVALRMQASAEPNNAELANKVGIELAKRGEYDEAMGAFQRAIAVDPRNVDAHYQMAGIYFIRGRTAEALDRFMLVDRLRPGYRWTNHYLAQIYRATGQKAKAEERQRAFETQKASGTLSES